MRQQRGSHTLLASSLVPPPGYRRGRGRPRTVRAAPVLVDHLDMRCYVTRRELVARHECDLAARHERDVMDSQPDDGGLYQRFLAGADMRLAYLPGQVTELALRVAVRVEDAGAREADLPTHEGASGAMQHLEQAYDLGDDVLLTCMACGSTELEVLAARIRFCESHQVAIGYWYELRCPECNDLHYKDDYQFSCPG